MPPSTPLVPPAQPAGIRPRIPESFMDVPSQRLYCLSFGLVCQAIKLVDFIRSVTTARDDGLFLWKKWLVADFLYCTVLRQLRIPRLHYSKAIVLLQIITLWAVDGFMFGAISLNMREGPEVQRLVHNRQDFFATPEPFSFADVLKPFSFLSGASSSRESHLSGQHTVRMSPISTARLNPNALTFCLAPPSNSVLIPILLNNTNPTGLRYSLTPLGYVDDSQQGKIEYFDLTSRDLRSIEQSRTEGIEAARTFQSRDWHSQDEYDEYGDDDDDENTSHSTLQRTQSLVHLKVTKPGVVRLERVSDASSVEARLVPTEVTVAPCPRVEFADGPWPEEDIRCAGEDKELQLMIKIFGLPPLSLRWSQTINDRREQFLVEGIDGNNDGYADPASTVQRPLTRSRYVPQELEIPLSLSAKSVGKYTYSLLEVADGVGNIIRVSPDHDKAEIQRSLHVLPRPAVSFKNCGPGNPLPLLIGSETSLRIAASAGDQLDAPFQVQLQYQPSEEAEEDGQIDKESKPWKKTTPMPGRETGFQVKEAGEYTIVGVQGKWCTGDVLSPETCKIVQKPLPTADIEWKRIHECSGDTGVSASLTLHGTPPFQVHYRIQRNDEHPQDLSKTFATSRGELTLQPERSGQYVFSFVHLSDANYRRVELHGPSIDQIIHPLAAAEFASGHPGVGRSKRVLSNCEGDVVDVDVDLRGTGPWNLDVQVIGPKSSEVLHFTDLKSPKETLHVPIPKLVNKEGGTFEIDLINIQDAYKCKRALTVPGITVNVRRLKPTARFYGPDGKRQTTILENELAGLPLRLTGDGPWKLKYWRTDAPDRVMTATINSPNDVLKVEGRGIYELLQVRDSQCPGSVIADASTYTVDWVPKPLAKLAVHTLATYEPSNSSYILPSICEGVSDSVDLDLTGRPPFQIMYNIAQSSDSGGIQLLDQPVFNSIQPRTRFQLQTSTPGRMYYEVKQIGDASYPLARHRSAVIPRQERLLFEQQVAMRPTARFKNRNRLSYCLNDAFVPVDYTSPDGVVFFDGVGPFTLKLRIKNILTSSIEFVDVTVHESIWKIDLPNYNFKSIGAHMVTIESVQDASRCVQAALDPLYNSIWVDVAETAAIVPVTRQTDFCVGDIAQFQLEGIPPWTIGYTINGKSYTQEAKASPFSLLQQQAGEFEITSIAHQQNKCKASVSDVRFAIHQLPSAQVGQGQRIYQDIHEGDQAEIKFTLIGEPPFTFTYQRSEPSSKKGGKPGKVLETHTVSRISSSEYSIFSALEGTWTVTSISDRYCRYPQTQPDLEKLRA